MDPFSMSIDMLCVCRMGPTHNWTLKSQNNFFKNDETRARDRGSVFFAFPTHNTNFWAITTGESASFCRISYLEFVNQTHSPVTFMGRPELLNIISTRSASTGMGHVMTVPPPWSRLKGSFMGNGGRSDLRASFIIFKAEDRCTGEVTGTKAEAS